MEYVCQFGCHGDAGSQGHKSGWSKPEDKGDTDLKICLNFNLPFSLLKS